MTPDPHDPGGPDERLSEFLLEYMESAERGLPPDPSDFLTRHPEYASELQEFLDTWDRLQGLTAPLRRLSRTVVDAARSGRPAGRAGGVADAAGKLESVGPYEILGEIGGGPQGTVYRAKLGALDRLVALKVCTRDLRTGDQILGNLSLATALEHPAVVRILEVSADATRVFVSSDWLEGGSLAARLGDCRGDPRAAARVVVTLARALEYARERGVTHLNLKPSNVLFDAGGRPYLTDFTPSRRPMDAAEVARIGLAPATVGYLAPEQILHPGGASSASSAVIATDVYGLGALLYALLTGKPPFQAPTVARTLEQIRNDPPHAPRALNASVDRDLERVCLRCLAKVPTDRYGSPGEMADDLGRWLDGKPVEAGDTPAGSHWLRNLVQLEGARKALPGSPAHAGEIGRLGPCRLLEVIGGGGMGIVFRGEDVDLQRPVAVKVLRPELAADAGARERFLREARLAAALDHENVVAVYQVGEEAGIPFLAMQWLRGMSLEEVLRRTGRLEVPAVLRLGRQISLGLAAAHAHGLLHRDVKPANLWLEGPAPGGRPFEGGRDAADRGRIKILDFGVARAATEPGHLTQSGTPIGTPLYMAPEQVTGGPVDARCDLFSLGVVLYRMCTGQFPFGRRSPGNQLSASDSPRPVHELRPELSRELSALVMELLSRDPAGRPASAAEVAERLAALQESRSPAGPTAERATAPPQAVRGRNGRRPWLAVGALALMLPLAYFFGRMAFGPPGSRWEREPAPNNPAAYPPFAEKAAAPDDALLQEVARRMARGKERLPPGTDVLFSRAQELHRAALRSHRLAEGGRADELATAADDAARGLNHYVRALLTAEEDLPPPDFGGPPPPPRGFRPKGPPPPRPGPPPGGDEPWRAAYHELQHAKERLDDVVEETGAAKAFLDAARAAYGEARKAYSNGEYRRAAELAHGADIWTHVGEHLRRAGYEVADEPSRGLFTPPPANDRPRPADRSPAPPPPDDAPRRGRMPPPPPPEE